MSLVGNTPLQKNAMNHHGVKEAFFDTFFQKKATAQLSAKVYTQSVSENFGRFSFTGKERDEETGYGYFGARYMDHELMTGWLSVDPMSDRYPSISPYAYCAWNPVKLVDPNGLDIWEINSQGKVVNHIKDKSKDAFYMVDDKGARQSSISFKYGTITGSNGEMWFSSTTSFNVNSQSAGAELFKFFADNTMIEYGLINTESNGSIVTTDHKTNKVNALKIAKELDKKGQTITSIVHNHPHNSKPSGFKKDDTHGDKFAVQQFQTSQGHLIDYYVYTPNNGKLIQFDNLRFYGSESWNAVFSTSSSRIYPTVKSHHGVGLSPR